MKNTYSSYSLETFEDDKYRVVEIEPSYNVLMDFDQVVLLVFVVVASYQDENEAMEYSQLSLDQNHYNNKKYLIEYS
jgi:hypothetical protein